MSAISPPKAPPAEKKFPVTIAAPGWLLDALDCYADSTEPPTKRSPLFCWILSNWLKDNHPDIHAAHAPSETPAKPRTAAA